MTSCYCTDLLYLLGKIRFEQIEKARSFKETMQACSQNIYGQKQKPPNICDSWSFRCAFATFYGSIITRAPSRQCLVWASLGT